jgi:hypothetical protein
MIMCRSDIPDQPQPALATQRKLWWMVAEDTDPGPDVLSVMRVGDEPDMRRWVRLPGGRGWAQCGSLVDFYGNRTPPESWRRLGRCSAETDHPVTMAWRRPTDGLWIIGGERVVA